jgi:hypothetical protein
MKRNINVHIGKNPELDQLIQSALFKAGYKWCGDSTGKYNGTGLDTYGKNYSIYLDDSNSPMYGDRDPSIARDSKEMSVPEFLEYLKGSGQVKVGLSSGLTVTVTKKGWAGLTISDMEALYKTTQKLK